MTSNIEIKAKIHDFQSLKKAVENISDTKCEKLIQEDIFFNVKKGRLKLRIFSPNYSELIYYERSNFTGPKQSNYFISPSQNPDSLKQVLEAVFGTRGIVRKVRSLYKVGNTRIHLDEVEHLGPHLELEVIMELDQTPEQGQRVANELMKQLNVSEKDLIDLLILTF